MMKKTPGKSRATLRDVAKLAGVSVSTASFSLNGGQSVREETCRRIAKAAEDLNYIPNGCARSLVTQRNLVLGVIRCIDKLGESFYAFNTTVDTYLSEMLKSIEQESVGAGYSLMVDWANTLDSTAGLPHMYEDGKVDGVMMVGGIVNDALPARLAKRGIPTVMAGSRTDILDWVDTDYTKAIHMAVSYLVSLGHRKIAFINGPDISQTSALKLRGYREGSEENGLSINEKMIRKGDFSGQAGYDAMKSIWADGLRPTALITAVDSIAIGALRFLHEKGVRCPEDVSIVGFEDGILAEYAIPPLTTVSAEKQTVGETACRLLIERILHPECPHQRVVIEPRLVVRGSTRPLETPRTN